MINYPVFTEKSTNLLEKQDKYTFELSRQFTKPQIRVIVEKLCSVRVRAVNTIRGFGKKRGSAKGTRFKRAFITVEN